MHIHPRFINGFSTYISIQKDEQIRILHIHFGFDPIANRFQIGVDLDPPGLLGFLFLDRQDIGVDELAESKLK